MPDLAGQIAGELDARISALADLLGLDVLDVLGPRVEGRARLLAHQLTSDDDALAAQTVIDLAAAGIIPDDPGTNWWATPLGRAVACSVGHPSADAVSYSVAGAMLGVTRGRVGQLVAAGRLDRHPDGGVTVVSVQERLRSQT